MGQGLFMAFTQEKIGRVRRQLKRVFLEAEKFDVHLRKPFGVLKLLYGFGKGSRIIHNFLARINLNRFKDYLGYSRFFCKAYISIIKIGG